MKLQVPVVVVNLPVVVFTANGESAHIVLTVSIDRFVDMNASTDRLQNQSVIQLLNGHSVSAMRLLLPEFSLLVILQKLVLRCESHHVAPINGGSVVSVLPARISEGVCGRRRNSLRVSRIAQGAER